MRYAENAPARQGIVAGGAEAPEEGAAVLDGQEADVRYSKILLASLAIFAAVPANAGGPYGDSPMDAFYRTQQEALRTELMRQQLERARQGGPLEAPPAPMPVPSPRAPTWCWVQHVGANVMIRCQ